VGAGAGIAVGRVAGIPAGAIPAGEIAAGDGGIGERGETALAGIATGEGFGAKAAAAITGALAGAVMAGGIVATAGVGAWAFGGAVVTDVAVEGVVEGIVGVAGAATGVGVMLGRGGLSCMAAEAASICILAK
jgi:hypothetical protein